ncbi:MAG: molybdopterin-dependent oxidoreductase [Acidobacteria bacterium]|nr:molybdopterin-dependent oxidoreductase [Acidobacteriota bacterium]
MMKENPYAPRYSRRDFAKFVGSGIVVFFTAQGHAQAPKGKMPGFGPPAGESDWNAYLRIGEDGRVTVFSGKVEMGQANTTALAQMAAEELAVSVDSIDMVMGDTALCPWDMGTFGSMSVRVYGAALRSAAAEAREILLELGSERLSLPVTGLKAENGEVAGSGKRVAYGELARGQKIARKAARKPALHTPAEFRVIGQPVERLDGRAKVTGAAKYTGDLRFPGMLYAAVLRPPAHGATLKTIDTSEAEKVPGVRLVREEGLVALLAEDPETARLARSKVKAEYDVPSVDVDHNSIFTYLLEKAPKPQPQERRGDLAEGEKAAVQIFEHAYYNGYGAHAPMEPHTALARMEGDTLTVWLSTQTPFMAQPQIASQLKMAPEKVRVIPPHLGGAFGGKSITNEAHEAARLAVVTGRPVMVAFDRREEFFYDAFRPAAIVKIRSGVDSAGKICLWDYEVYYAGNRSAEQFYDVPHNLMRVYGGWMGMPGTHPFNTGTWRAPGANINVFARESQVDIMAAHLRADPLEFRLQNTSDARMRRVLEEAAKRFGYSPAPAPSRRGIGMACGIDAGSYVAEIAEVAVDGGRIAVRRVTAAQEMGVSVNPKGSVMQMEGCITMGLGYTLTEDIEFEGGKILTTNFHQYRIPRFSMLPKIDAFLVKNDALDPQGGGEPAVVPVGGAIANALFDATGVRAFHMPMTPQRVRAAAENPKTAK